MITKINYYTKNKSKQFYEKKKQQTLHHFICYTKETEFTLFLFTLYGGIYSFGSFPPTFPQLIKTIMCDANSAQPIAEDFVFVQQTIEISHTSPFGSYCNYRIWCLKTNSYAFGSFNNYRFYFFYRTIIIDCCAQRHSYPFGSQNR